MLGYYIVIVIFFSFFVHHTIWRNQSEQEIHDHSSTVFIAEPSASDRHTANENEFPQQLPWQTAQGCYLNANCVVFILHTTLYTSFCTESIYYMCKFLCQNPIGFRSDRQVEFIVLN